ncbi:MAG: AarF/ABC1/UbiB kinase family protein [Candidatus Promineifilaceae bacterium]
MSERTSTLPQTPDRIDRRRYRRILTFFAGIILHIILLDLIASRLPLLQKSIRRSRPQRYRRASRRFRDLAVDMGGVMIKLGQFLSARVDILPPEVTEELAGLQDEVSPVPNEAIQQVLQTELGDLSRRFAEIDAAPLAAASLGQAHAAWLLPASADQRHNGQPPQRGAPVVIKVQRPGIEDLVRTDLSALRVVARWVMRYHPIRRRANVPALLEEFARTLWEELDYHAEAGNAERFALIFADEPDVRVPAVYWQHSTNRVLTLERMAGIKITDTEAIRAANIDTARVADRLLEVYFRQFFLEGFFHADPHPGNLFINPGDPLGADAPRPFELVFVDFGMMGHIKESLSQNLQKVLVSVARQDAHTLTQAYMDMGFLLPGADLERIEEAQKALLERIWGRKLLEMARPDPAEVRELSLEFRDILFELPFQVPQDFVYLGRAVGMISGLASRLNPEINPWYQFEKFALEVVQSQPTNPFSLEQVGSELRGLLAMPARARRLLEAAESGKLRIRSLPDPQTTRRLERLEKRVNQLNWGLVSTAALISGTALYVSGETFLGSAFWVAAAILFLIALWRS